MPDTRQAGARPAVTRQNEQLEGAWKKAGTPLACKPSRKGFGEGQADVAQGSEKQVQNHYTPIECAHGPS